MAGKKSRSQEASSRRSTKQRALSPLTAPRPTLLRNRVFSSQRIRHLVYSGVALTILGVALLSSDLIQKLQAATYTWVQTAWSGTGDTAYADDFERSSLGARWTVRAGTPVISANSDFAGTSADQNFATYSATSFSNDQWAAITVGAISSGHETQVCVRATNTGNVNAYCMATDGVTFTIYRLSNLAWAADIATSVATPGVGDSLRIEAEGTAIRGYLNDTLVMSGTDANYASGYPAVSVWSSGVPTSTIESAAVGELPYNNTTVAIHPTNQNGWTEYSLRDTSISAGSTVMLSPTTQSMTETSDTDFSAGSHSGTVVSGTGSTAAVALSNGAIDPPVLNQYATSRAYQDTTYDSVNQVVWATSQTANAQLVKFPIDGSAETAYTFSGMTYYGIKYDPNRQSLWISASNNHLYEISPTTRAVLNDYNVGISGEVELDTVNQNVYIHNGWLSKRINVGGTGLKNCFYDIDGYSEVKAILPNAAGTYVYYVVLQVEGGAYELIRASSALCTDMSSFVSTPLGTDLVEDGTGQYIWGSSADGLVKINTTTWAINRYDAGVGYTGLVYDSNLNVLWSGKTTVPNQLRRFNATTGAIVGTSVSMNDFVTRSMTRVPTNNTIWYAGQQIHMNRVTTVGYTTPGTFTSQILDTGGVLRYSTLTYTATVPANTTVAAKVRTASQADMSDASAWALCGTIASGGNINDPYYNCGGFRYAQYQLTLTTSDSTVSPSVADITIGYDTFTSGTITSSPFDTIDATNVVAKIAFTQATSGTTDTNIVTDTFERAGPSLGANWTDHYGGEYAHICNGSDFCGLDSFGYNMAAYTGTRFLNDQFSEIVISAASANHIIAPIVRDNGQDASFYAAATDGSSFFNIWRAWKGFDPDAPTSILTIGAPYPQPGDTLRIEAVGSSIRAYVNGALRGTVSDTLIAGGRPGIFAKGQTGQGTGEAESWRGGDVTSLGGSVKFQLRTSANGSTWGPWLGPTGANDYYTDPAGAQAINSQHTDGSNDRYVQYRASVTPGSALTTPSLSSVTTTYVVNAPPEFESAATATQGSDGVVSISYRVRNSDTDSDTGSVGLITPSYEYSINNGSDWSPITTGLSAGATTPKSVDDVNYTTHNVTWNAKAQIDGVYAAQAKVRVTASDLQAANATAQSTSIAFALDVKNPTLASPAISVDASTSPANVTLNAADDSSFQMCVTLDNTATNCVPYADNATITLTTDPDTVYVIFKDSVGNTASASATTPQTPSNLIIRDLTNIATNEYQLFLTWAASSVPIGQFSQYRVLHSTDGSSYAEVTTINDRAINYFFHKSLGAGTTHYYRIVTATNTGNISYRSSAVSGVANGQGGGNDVVAPTISSVTISSISTQSAVVTWDTDELANSTIGYSATAANFGTEVGVPTMLDNAAGVGQHQVTLNNLTPNTTYYLKVMSADPSGNESADVHLGDGYSFLTLSGPVITNVTTTEIGNTQAIISWQTNLAANSSVVYSSSPNLSTPVTVTTADLVTNHTVTLTGLTLGARYYFKVQSGVATDSNGGTYFTFVTTADSTAPLISNITIEPITDTQAVVLWTTNERATGQLSYGTVSGNYAVVLPTETALNITHATTISTLTAATPYVFVITSADAAGNTTTSTEQTFTTKEKQTGATELQQLISAAASADSTAPALRSISVTDITDATATVTWITDEPANSFVQFGKNTEESLVFGNWVYDATHSIRLTGLKPTTNYTYTVISADTHGNTSTATSASFSTVATPITVLEEQLAQQLQDIATAAQALPGPVISGQPGVDLTSTTATISWTTDKSANSLVSYSSDAEFAQTGAYTQTVGEADRFVRTHRVLISNLTPDTLYHFQSRSKTEVSVLATTNDYTFRTPKKVFAIENYSVDTPTTDRAIFRWITSEAASGTVHVVPYRNNIRALDELKTVIDESNSLIHQFSISDLEPALRYSVELISVNAAGLRTSRTIDAFSTTTVSLPPAISNIRVDSALSPGEKVKVQTIVSWNTNIPATSQVFYREGVGRADTELPEKTELDGSYTKRHIVVITTFNPGSVYQLRVESKDSNGQTATAKPITMLTPQQERTVFQVISNTFTQVFGWTKVFN